MSLGWASPKPQPPSRSCATIAPAHLPDLNPQQPEAQSASLEQGPVMNWLPGATDGAGVVGAVVAATVVAAAAEEVVAAAAVVVAAAAVVVAGASPRSLRAALSFGCASPKPQPPSRSWATMAPAHFPDLNPQHPEAQSVSLEHGPVMNWLPGATEGAAEVGAAAEAVATAVAVVVAGSSPRSLRAALSLGWGSPKPQPPSRSWATIAPAHLPDLKPQQPEAQSTSPEQGPVMNCEPGAARGTYVAAATRRIKGPVSLNARSLASNW